MKMKFDIFSICCLMNIYLYSIYIILSGGFTFISMLIMAGYITLLLLESSLSNIKNPTLGICSYIFVLVAWLGISTVSIMNLDTRYYCKTNSISYPLVQTICEYTDASLKDTVIILKHAAEVEMDLPNALKLIAPDLSDSDIITILDASIIKEREE